MLATKQNWESILSLVHLEVAAAGVLGLLLVVAKKEASGVVLVEGEHILNAVA